MWVLLIVMAALAGGIIFVANRSAVPKKDRKGRLQELARFVEGRMEEIPASGPVIGSRLISKDTHLFLKTLWSRGWMTC